MKTRQRVLSLVATVILGTGVAVALVAPAQAATYPHRLVHANSGLCLDVPAFSTQAGTQLQLYPCNGGSNQVFNFMDAYNPWQYFLQNPNSFHCLQPGAPGLMNSTIIQWTCNFRSSAQEWFFLFPYGEGGLPYRQLWNTLSGLCLGVQGGYAGAYAVQHKCGSDDIWLVS